MHLINTQDIAANYITKNVIFCIQFSKNAKSVQIFTQLLSAKQAGLISALRGEHLVLSNPIYVPKSAVLALISA